MSKKNLVGLIKLLKSLDSNENIYFYDYEHEAGGPFCSSASIETEYGILRGWGFGKNRSEANYLSLVEVYERYLTQHFTPINFKRRKFPFCSDHIINDFLRNSEEWVANTSNGCAIHVSKNKSQISALSELIERHTILKATVEKISPYQVSKVELKKAILPYTALDNMDVYLWRGPLGFFVAIASYRYQAGVLYGFGASKNKNSSILKAYVELRGSLPGLAEYSILDLKKNEVILPENVMDFHLAGRSDRMPSILRSHSPNIYSVGPDLNYSDFYFFSIPSKCLFPGDNSNFWYSRVVSNNTQPLFYDYWRDDYINSKAIPSYDYSLDGDLHVIS